MEHFRLLKIFIVNGLLIGVVFIDLIKAFDTTDHEIILRKMSYLMSIR